MSQNLRVASAPATVENALERLQQVLREPDPPPSTLGVYNGEIPEDLRGEHPTLTLHKGEKRAFDQACQLMADDLRFEYLKARPIHDSVWRFVCEFVMRGTKGLVERLITEHEREIIDTVCYFPVLFLTVQEELELHGVRFTLRRAEGKQSQPGSVAAVPCRGTDYGEMAKRARQVAEHALRVLRATLRDYSFMPDEQLRFRLGYSMCFEGVAGGWSNQPDQGGELELDEPLLRTARAAPLFTLPLEGRTDVERRTNTALKWFEQAQLVGNPLMEVLFCFTALEAILGDKHEGLKAPNRAMLSLVTKGGFRHPSVTFALYDQVRSAAVHGEKRPTVDEKSAEQFAWDVRCALNEFLEFARSEGMTKRSQVRKALDGHPRRSKVVTGLLRNDPKTWKKFLEPE